MFYTNFKLHKKKEEEEKKFQPHSTYDNLTRAQKKWYKKHKNISSREEYDIAGL